MTPSRDGQEREVLASGSRELGVELDEGQRGLLLRYLDLVYVWNRSAGLTTIARGDAVRLHVLDSLAAVDFVGAGPCLDLGTGAGLPGLVLAMARTDVEFTLVESNRRRCSFLLEAARCLPVPNVRIVESDVESLPRQQRFPVVVSRAFRPPAEFLAIATDFVAADGKVVLMLADPAQTELESLAAASRMTIAAVRRLNLPGGGEPRTVVSFAAP